MIEKKISILGVEFSNTTLDNLFLNLSSRILNKERTFVITANPEIVMYAQNDHLYREILKKADFVTADGIGIVMAASILKKPLPERVTGFELMLKLLQYANEQRLKIYLLGAKEETLKKTIYHINTHYPNTHIVGSHHGFFNWEINDIPEQIIRTQPDIVFVALGFPKQEEWIYKNLEKFNNGTFMGVGGSFDVLSGDVKRAPVLWQKLNIEWLYRLVKQPSRWRRMMALPKFALKVFMKKFSKKQFE